MSMTILQSRGFPSEKTVGLLYYFINNKNHVCIYELNA